MIRSYIIHLARSPERAPLVSALMPHLPAAEVVDAVDGRAITDAERAAALARFRYRPDYPFALLDGEVGVFLSHRRCWQKIVASCDAFGLIAEDDVALDPAVFAPALALALRHARADRLIRFPLQNREVPREILDSSGAIRLYAPRVIGLSSALQVVGAKVAARLLELTEPFDRPVDTFLQMRWLTGADVVSVYPNGASSFASGAGGSTIQRKVTLWHEVGRSLVRARYRAKVAQLSRRG